MLKKNNVCSMKTEEAEMDRYKYHSGKWGRRKVKKIKSKFSLEMKSVIENLN